MFAIQITKSICEISSKAVFDFWSDEEFRSQVNFDIISKTDQDRIFNELQVSVLGLLNLKLIHLSEQMTENEAKAFYRDLQENLTQGFLEIFKDLNISAELLKQWQQLIDIRFEEYNNDYKLSLLEGSKWQEFAKDPNFLPTWARIETITIDSLSHIRKGKVEEKDLLWKMLRKWLTMMEVTFTKILSIQDQPHKPIKS